MTANVFKETVQALRQQGLNSDEILERLEILSDFYCAISEKNNLEEEEEAPIKRLLKNICMPVHLDGYRYWIDALTMYRDDKGIAMMELYYKIAEKNGKTSSQVERAMRTALDKTFILCPVAQKDAIFETNVSQITGLPTNEQFLAVLSELI